MGGVTISVRMIGISVSKFSKEMFKIRLGISLGSENLIADFLQYFNKY